MGPPRRLVVLMDGTWQSLKEHTNVALLDKNIDNGNKAGDLEQIVKYFPGVGSQLFWWIRGGLFGWGLSQNIKDAFLWLSKTYLPGDLIYVFGFSRGAYSARSLVGLMHRCDGVLRQPSPRLINEAWALYHYPKRDTTTFRTEHCIKARVHMIGVWDTVGSLGIPLTAFPLAWLPLFRNYYSFHDTNLSCIVNNAYHALAIDEYRQDFSPTLWDATTAMNKHVEQCWFVGDHANIGGGSTTNDKLSTLSYVWMQDRAVEAGLRMKTKLTAHDEWRQKPDDSYATFLWGLYRLWKLGRRNNRKLGMNVEEVLHPSVLERVRNVPAYRPKPLENVGIPDLTTIPKRQYVKACGCEKMRGAPTS